MDLHFRQHGTPGKDPTLILLHGLFGSSANWGGVARRLSADFHLVVPDLRNHGRSPHHADVSYAVQAQDVLRLMDRLGVGDSVIVGHSMGGKVAMMLALQHADRVERLVAADIAPVTYTTSFDPIFDALESVDLEQVEGREQVESHLAATLGNTGLRNFLMQNLVKDEHGWRWRLNLVGLRRSIDELVGFPDAPDSGYPGPALFIYGGRSDYVSPAAQPVIMRLFPYARLRQVADAGHWLIAEKPDEFAGALRSFVT
ncbi:MAG: alpha/beta fold hydrolase [Pseudomonadota bacterium]